MCMFQQPDMPTPEAPPEYAQQRSPDNAAVKDSTTRRTQDRIRAGADTILTSGSGVTSSAPTDKKTLLGQ